MLNTSFTPFPVLATERLTLRQLAITDDQQILALRSDHIVNKYLDRPLSKTIEEARRFIDRINENIRSNSSLYCAIALNDGDLLIGTISLFNFSDEHSKCEIGYELLPNFYGQGVMKEALKCVIDYAFNQIKVRKIEACVHRDNQRSIKLLERFSFSETLEMIKPKTDLRYYYLPNPRPTLDQIHL